MSIDLNISPELEQMLAAVRKLLAERFPPSRLRGGLPGNSRAEISALAELGFLGIAVPESAGGVGLGIVEEVLVHVELGRHLAAPDVLAAPLAARLVAERGNDALAAEILSGARRVCLGTLLSDSMRSGAEALLFNPTQEGLALVLGSTGAFLIDTASVSSVDVAATDRSVAAQRARLGDGAIIGRVGGADAPVLLDAHLLISAHLLGMAEAVRDMAVAYASVRQQFDQPIGAFQAVKHRCANMAINSTALQAQLILASLSLREFHADAAFHVNACRLLAARYALENARSNIQVHGGIGFSAECDAHLYLLRMHLYENLGTTRGALLQGFLDRPAPAFLRHADSPENA